MPPRLRRSTRAAPAPTFRRRGTATRPSRDELSQWTGRRAAMQRTQRLLNTIDPALPAAEQSEILDEVMDATIRRRVGGSMQMRALRTDLSALRRRQRAVDQRILTELRQQMAVTQRPANVEDRPAMLAYGALMGSLNGHLRNVDHRHGHALRSFFPEAESNEVALEILRELHYRVRQELDWTEANIPELPPPPPFDIQGALEDVACEGTYECPICLTEPDGNAYPCAKLRIPDCVHKFHRDCIAQWLERDQRCPICRRNATQWPTPAWLLRLIEEAEERERGNAE